MFTYLHYSQKLVPDSLTSDCFRFYDMQQKSCAPDYEFRVLRTLSPIRRYRPKTRHNSTIALSCLKGFKQLLNSIVHKLLQVLNDAYRANRKRPFGHSFKVFVEA